MKNIKTSFNLFLLKFIKIKGLTVEQHIEAEAQNRSKIWQDEMSTYAKACAKLHDIIFLKDEEIASLKFQISGVPTKKQIFDNYLEEQVESGELKYSLPEEPLITEEEKEFIFKVEEDDFNG